MLISDVFSLTSFKIATYYGIVEMTSYFGNNSKLILKIKNFPIFYGLLYNTRKRTKICEK